MSESRCLQEEEYQTCTVLPFGKEKITFVYWNLDPRMLQWVSRTTTTETRSLNLPNTLEYGGWHFCDSLRDNTLTSLVASHPIYLSFYMKKGWSGNFAQYRVTSNCIYLSYFVRPLFCMGWSRLESWRLGRWPGHIQVGILLNKKLLVRRDMIGDHLCVHCSS